VSVPSFQFLGLVAIVAAILAPSAGMRWRRGVLFVANLGFFCTFAQGTTLAQGALSLVPFVGFLAFGFLAMRVVETYRNRIVFWAILALLIGGLCWLKKYAFFPGSLLLTQVYVATGLSYAFFRVVGLVVDAYQSVLPARVNLFGYVNYTLNFTSFVSGPIELYKPFRRDEVESPAPLDRAVAGDAVRRIVLGFFKVTILSPLLFAAQQRAIDFSTLPTSFAGGVLIAALIVAIYPIALYVNFSGYTDVVIGAARFLRLEMPENFNKPFSARGFLEFWNRWHMSLSNWFKTYVYSPLLLALMRRFPSRSIEPLLGVLAYFVTFFLVGMWHGQTPMFVILGLLMGLGVSGNKLYQINMVRRLGRAGYQALCANGPYASLSSGLTFLWLAAALVFMWGSQEQLVHFALLFGPVTIALALLGIWLAAAAFNWISTSVVSGISSLQAGRVWSGAAVLRPAYYAALAVIVVSVAVILDAPAPHLVYKAF
jgi:alginate O-acetyltransferase complex protein AlgI